MSLASNFARSVKVELIAKLVTSYEAYDGGTLIKNVARHNVRDYFRKYGSTARKFDHIESDDIYVGYVRMPGKPEFLSAIVLAGEHAVAISFDAETDDSNDFLTLMAKKEFAERMTAAMQRASAIMRKVVAPTPVAPAAVPEAAAAKKDNSVGWMLIAIVAVIGGAIFLIPMLTAQTARETENPMANFRLQDSYEQGGPQYSATPPVSADIPQSYEQKGSVIEGVTYGMADAIETGIDELNASFSEGGMWGAEAASIACWDKAKSSTSIFEVDRCAAFDLTAQYRDGIAHGSIGTPLNEHFSNTTVRMRQAYSRFSESSEQRIALVEGQTAILLRDLST